MSSNMCGVCACDRQRRRSGLTSTGNPDSCSETAAGSDAVSQAALHWNLQAALRGIIMGCFVVVVIIT